MRLKISKQNIQLKKLETQLNKPNKGDRFLQS